MPKTLIKSRLHSNKNKPKISHEINNIKSKLPPHLQSFKQKFQVMMLLSINELKRLSIIR